MASSDESSSLHKVQIQWTSVIVTAEGWWIDCVDIRELESTAIISNLFVWRDWLDQLTKTAGINRSAITSKKIESSWKTNGLLLAGMRYYVLNCLSRTRLQSVDLCIIFWLVSVQLIYMTARLTVWISIYRQWNMGGNIYLIFRNKPEIAQKTQYHMVHRIQQRPWQQTPYPEAWRLNV